MNSELGAIVREPTAHVRVFEVLDTNPQALRLTALISTNSLSPLAIVQYCTFEIVDDSDDDVHHIVLRCEEDVVLADLSTVLIFDSMHGLCGDGWPAVLAMRKVWLSSRCQLVGEIPCQHHLVPLHVRQFR